MKTHIQYIAILLMLSQVLMTACKKTDQAPLVLATVGQKRIYLNEFRDRLNYIPATKFNTPKKMKLWGLNSLIAEKLLSTLASYGPNSKPQSQIDQQNRESVIEALWQNIILSKISVSDSILWKFYLKKNHTRVIKFILVDDSLLAQKIFTLWSDGDKKIDQQAQTDTIAFGAIDFINDPVFNASLGKVILFPKTAKRFLMIKPIRDFQNVVLSQSDFTENKASIKKAYLKKEKSRELKIFVTRNFKEKPYNLNKMVFTEFAQFLDRTLFDIKDEQTKTLQDVSETNFTNGPIWQKSVVSFPDGQTWTVKKLYKRLTISPYRISLTSHKEFRYGIIKATRRTLDDEVLYSFAIKNTLAKKPYVIWQKSMWANYYKSETLLSDKKRNKRDWLETLDSLKSHTDIHVNWAMLDSLKIMPTRMMVLKSHFPGRTMVPPLRSWWLNIKP